MKETWETWVRRLAQEDPLEEEMAPHASILAWQIPGTEQSGVLQSMGRKESDMTEQLSTHASYLQFLHLFNAFPSTPYSVLSGRCTF